ncbi:MAG: ATP-binding protein, partial [Chitinispirillaceae bacterium]|nr:ATP-binding protein [Chitinispirillaceae bacterium]
DKIESASKLIFNLNRQLSLISRGANPLKEYCSIKTLIENSLKLALSGSSVDYKLNVPENIYSIYADPSQLNQVFLNLFVNARQAMENGGIITINCKNIKVDGVSWIQIEVSDNGCGIDEEIIDKIFQPFFTTKKKGTGLGLAVVKSIVEKHGGTICVSSKKGIGSTFTLKLPALNILDSDETSLEMHCIKTEIKRNYSLQGKILVMDDDENIREIISAVLKKEGNKVYPVSTGGEAITKYLEHFSKGEPFDLLILDETIRNGYGAESVIKRVRQINKNAKAILMSAHIESNLIKEYQSYGFIGLLNKPFDTQQLISIVGKALSEGNKIA